MTERELKIAVEGGQVSGLLNAPKGASACYVVAHGAGAGMRHPFMTAVADGLAKRSIATLRYQFPYMERGSRRPDSPKVAHAAMRAAVAEAGKLKLPLIAGGKSFGGRMTSQAQAESALVNVSALAFLGFPLHAPGQPSSERAAHLFAVKVPMLFLQGARDDFAKLEYLKPLIKKLGLRASLKLFDHADHSFHVPAKSGRTDGEVMEELLDTFIEWLKRKNLADEPKKSARR